MAIYAHVAGWGKYVPQRVVTNDDITQFMDTSDEWIRTRTGIVERRFAGPEETTASMATTAAEWALAEANLPATAVDLIIVATLSPDYLFPSTACLVQEALGAQNAGAFDLSAACTGFIYALATGTAMIQSGAAKVALVIGSETVSRFLNDEDRTTYPLFGDGAGAVVLQASDVAGGPHTSVLRSDGGGAHLIGIPAGGSKQPATPETVAQRLHTMQMNGREVYRFATKIIREVVIEICARSGVGLEEIDLVIPHQANRRIIESACRAMNFSEEKVFINLHKYGNTSAASIPIALCEAHEAGRVHEGDNVLLVGFGGGLTWGATMIKWRTPQGMASRQRQNGHLNQPIFNPQW